MLVAFVVFSLGNSADVFILLRGFDLGLSAAIGTIAYVFYNLVYSGLAFPVGKLTNRIGAIRILMASLLAFAVVYAGLAAAGAAWQMWPLFALYGLHMALMDGTAPGGDRSRRRSRIDSARRSGCSPPPRESQRSSPASARGLPGMSSDRGRCSWSVRSWPWWR